MLTVKQLKHKRVYLDDATTELLHGMRQDRKTLKIQQKDLAKELSISSCTLRDYEYGRNTPSIYRFLHIAKLLGWEVNRNINCIFGRFLVNETISTLFRERISQLGMSLQELSAAVRFNVRSVSYTLQGHTEATATVFAALMRLLKSKHPQR